MATKQTTSSEIKNKKVTLKTIITNIFRIQEMGVFISLVVLGILLSVFTEYFATAKNIINVIRQASYYGMMAVGMVFVLSQGDIDLSVGSMYNLTSVIMAFLLQKGWSINIVFPIGLLVGSFLGFINGGLSVTLRLPSMIVTLGTMTMFYSLSLVVSSARTIAKFPKENWFFDIFGGKQFGFLPSSVPIMFIVAIMGYVIYSHTSFGRYICAIGANKRAARYSGIDVDLYRLLTMTLQGFICGIAGCALLGFMKAAEPSLGKGSEMMVISAAIIGGSSLSGGSGTIFGAIIGAIIIAVIRNGLVLLGVSAYWQGFVTGLTIIAAVFLDSVIKKRRGGVLR